MGLVGQSVPRLEDRRLLTGEGRYTADTAPADAAHAVFVRSPYAHAEIVGIDVAAANAAPGVLAVLTGADAEAAGLGKITCPRKLPDHSFVDPKRPILAQGRVRFIGDPVVMVVAESEAQAGDAAALVEVDYDPLPSVTDTAGALAGEQLWPQAAENVCVDWSTGDAGAVEAAMAEAAHVVELELINNRLAVTTVEPRCTWGRYDPSADTYLLHTPSQGVFHIRSCLADDVFGVDKEKIEVLTEDVGGAFGMKIFLYPEHPCVLWASKVTGRPVAWTSTRLESFQSDAHARDHVTKAWLALDEQARFLALKIDTVANLGAYLSTVAPTIPTLGYAKMAPSVYRLTRIHMHVLGVFTNTAPIDAYRGAGKPEAQYVFERLIEVAARRLGMDAAELRRRNLVRTHEMPWTTPVNWTMDSGDFEKPLNRALTVIDRAGFADRRARSAASGKRRGLGFAYYVHGTGGDPSETSRLVAEASGALAAYTGTQDSGQGHRTVYAQLLADRLGLPLDVIEVRQGIASAIGHGGGTGGSSSLIISGTSLVAAGSKLIEAGREAAAAELEVAAADIEYADGVFQVAGTDRRIALFELSAKLVEPLAVTNKFDEDNASFPYGVQACEVEIDPQTGALDLLRYVSVDDLGTLVHPAMAESQLVGGIVQGLGQAMCEHVRYDTEDGQLLTGSLMDYALPRAADMPGFEVTLAGAPTGNNSLGIKGVGECGTMAAPSALINAVVDALADLGVEHVDMPVTPERLWRAIRDA
ncbi:MAG: xanthine dehydrogenase family protein molybdopterin-binding subunit [Alphaproteobacteria bacterium]